MRTNKAEDIWDRVDMTGGSDACWRYLGTIDNRGYGIIPMGGRPHKAHRVAWELTNGAIPDGMFVCHHCDQRDCINPAHLFIGTHDDNMRDMVQKSRQATGEFHGRNTKPDRTSRGDTHSQRMRNCAARGSRHFNAKLTESQVAEIRERFNAGETNQTALGREFGVSHTVIRRVLRGTGWAHVGLAALNPKGEDHANSI